MSVSLIRLLVLKIKGGSETTQPKFCLALAFSITADSDSLSVSFVQEIKLGLPNSKHHEIEFLIDSNEASKRWT